MIAEKEKNGFKASLAYIFSRNPVLVLGLVIGQLAAGDTTLKNGVALSITYLLITVPVLVFASVIGKKLPDWFKIVSYAVLSAAMLLPSYFICGSISATIFFFVKGTNVCVSVSPTLTTINPFSPVSSKPRPSKHPLCAHTPRSSIRPWRYS